MLQAPNYTQTPNIFFDEIMKTLNEGEMRILLVIMRQTLGWHKAEDWITLKMLGEKTGYERRSVCRILDRLIEKKLVRKRIQGNPGNERCYYSLVMEEVPKEKISDDDGIETEEEKAIFQKSYTSDRRVTPPVTHGSPPPVTGRSPTKETNTKETIQKKQQQQPLVDQKSRPSQAVESTAAAVRIYSSLEKIDIPIDQKIEITTKNVESIVIGAIAWATHPNNPPTKSLVASIKFACKNNLNTDELNRKKESPYEMLCKIFKNGDIYNGAECFLSPTGIAFHRGLLHKQVEINEYFTFKKVKEICDIFGIVAQ